MDSIKATPSDAYLDPPPSLYLLLLLPIQLHLLGVQHLVSLTEPQLRRLSRELLACRRPRASSDLLPFTITARLAPPPDQAGASEVASLAVGQGITPAAAAAAAAASDAVAAPMTHAVGPWVVCFSRLPHRQASEQVTRLVGLGAPAPDILITSAGTKVGTRIAFLICPQATGVRAQPFRPVLSPALCRPPVPLALIPPSAVLGLRFPALTIRSAPSLWLSSCLSQIWARCQPTSPASTTVAAEHRPDSPLSASQQQPWVLCQDWEARVGGRQVRGGEGRRVKKHATRQRQPPSPAGKPTLVLLVLGP